VISEGGVNKEQSIPITAEEVPGFKSDLVTMTEVPTPTYPAGDAPTVSVSLAGGDDGATVSTAVLGASLDTLRYDLGPSQVAIPGNSDPDVHALLDAHCDKNHRVAVADLPDSADPLELGAAVDAISELPGKGRQILSLGQVLDYPGEVAPAVWEVPYSGVQMGIIARVDALNDPSQVAAGSLGYSRLALGPKRDFSDDEREALNYRGVTLAKVINNQVRTYGYRTSAGQDETNWIFFQESRVIMAIAHECDASMEDFVFKTIDGRGLIFGRVNVALTGICQRYWSFNALFGETPAEAFVVDTSYPGINTDETIAAGEIHAQVRLKTSRIAEWIALDIVKTTLERSLAA
jgi:phage tail sheath protein FI